MAGMEQSAILVPLSVHDALPFPLKITYNKIDSFQEKNMDEYTGIIPVEVEMRTPTPPANTEETKKSPAVKRKRKAKGKKTASKNLSTQMECNLCPFETDKRGALQDHYNEEHSKEDLVDTLISVSYPDVDDEATETKSGRCGSTKRTGTVIHTCPICQKSISGKNNLEKHLVRHSPQKPFKCEECLKTFSAKRDLNLHEMRHHSQERPHVCPTCNKGFVDKAYLKKHVTFHENSRPFVCHQCGKAFNNILGLQKHCKTHSQERPFMCEKCSKCFRVKYDLTVHKRNVHKESANDILETTITSVCAITSNVCTPLLAECTPVL